MDASTAPVKEVQIILPKIEKVLDLLLTFSRNSKASFAENITCLLDKALDHVTKLETEENSKQSGGSDAFIVLIHNAAIRKFINEILNVTTAPVVHPPILIFTIKLVLQLSSTEEKFTKFRREYEDVLIKIRQLSETTAVENNEVKHTLLTYFLALSKFQAGQKWLIDSSMFIFAIQSLEDRAIFIKKTSKEVVCLLMPALQEDQGKVAFENLLKPFAETQSTLGNHQLLCDKLEPFIDVLEYYLEKCLTGQLKSGGKMMRAQHLEALFLDLTRTINNEKLLSKVCSILGGVYTIYASEDPKNRKQYEEKTLWIIQLLLNRGFLRAALITISQSLFYWVHISAADEFHLHLVYLMFTPILLGTEETASHFDCYPVYIERRRNALRATNCGLGDTLEAMLEKNPELNELTGITVAGFRKSMDKLGRELSLRVTRAGLYLMSCLKNPESKRLSQFSFSSQLIIQLINSTCSFIDAYHIRWWESVETICFPSILTRVIESNASRNSQVTCAGLRGLKFCIQQFLHPDQVLLISNATDSTLNDAAKVVSLCLVSVHWEVRDSALEVVTEMAQLSQKRYPDFQKMLIRFDLLKSAIAGIGDAEPYVRASSVSAIAAASPVPDLWEHINCDFDVASGCLSILQNDGEALARRAAVKALTLATQAGHFSITGDRTALYKTMTSAALFDLDWEVKLQALGFWEVVFKEVLTNQGMLDGHFPEYTFSQEKQKIVKLDQKEIRRRLQQAISTLGSCGYLHVLLQSVDDCDTPVREKSIRLLRDMRDVLKAHQALDLSIWPKSTLLEKQTVPEIVESSDPIQRSEPMDADQVIEEILDQNDVTLMEEIITKSQPSQSKGELASVTSVDPTDFVAQMNVMELETMLQWTNVSSDLHIFDLDSLVDDIQDCIFTDNSRPQPDCY